MKEFKIGDRVHDFTVGHKGEVIHIGKYINVKFDNGIHCNYERDGKLMSYYRQRQLLHENEEIQIIEKKKKYRVVYLNEDREMKLSVNEYESEDDFTSRCYKKIVQMIEVK